MGATSSEKSTVVPLEENLKQNFYKHSRTPLIGMWLEKE